MVKHVKIEHLRDEVIGIRPVYGEFGNSTEILLKNGEVVLDKRMVISSEKALTGSYAIDLKAQRRQLRPVLKRKGGPLPFYLPGRRVFIPLKMRRPVSASDAVYGYIDLAYMGEPQTVSRRECAIQLSNGLTVMALSKRQTVLGAKYDGVAVQKFIEAEQAEEISHEQVLAAICLLANTIAAMVRRE